MTTKINFLPETTPLARKAMEGLLGKEVKVTKGFAGKDISKGQKGTVTTIHHVKDTGFMLGIKLYGRAETSWWATSPARFSGENISLNTGDPTKCLKLQRTGRLEV